MLFTKKYDVLDNKTLEPLVTDLTWEQAVNWQMTNKLTGTTHLRRAY